jgi:hypothetical protein
MPALAYSLFHLSVCSTLFASPPLALALAAVVSIMLRSLEHIPVQPWPGWPMVWFLCVLGHAPPRPRCTASATCCQCMAYVRADGLSCRHVRYPSRLSPRSKLCRTCTKVGCCWRLLVNHCCCSRGLFVSVSTAHKRVLPTALAMSLSHTPRRVDPPSAFLFVLQVHACLCKLLHTGVT